MTAKTGPKPSRLHHPKRCRSVESFANKTPTKINIEPEHGPLVQKRIRLWKSYDLQFTASIRSICALCLYFCSDVFRENNMEQLYRINSCRKFVLIYNIKSLNLESKKWNNSHPKMCYFFGGNKHKTNGSSVHHP